MILILAIPLSAQDRIQQNSERIIAHALNSSQSYETLAYLTDNIGPRLSGSRGLTLAVAWTTKRFRDWGIDVRNERVMVPHWTRGVERGRLVTHNSQRIVLTALGGSVATPADGIMGDVVEVNSEEELKALGRSKVNGKIVLFNRAMDATLVADGRAFEAYSKAVEFRGKGADLAAPLGAAAVLVRSVTSSSLRTPHTGSVRYEGKVKKIPAAAVTVEDAMLLHRLLKKGERVRMHLTLTPRTLPDVESANVVAEIRGTELPDEIVLIGGHLDSWDLGTGAIDNGSGVAMVMETMRILKELGIRPRRTIRCVLFTNEENGLRGGRGYAKDHAAELPKHVAAIETDAGTAGLEGFRTTIGGEALAALEARLEPILQRIAPATFVTTRNTGADTGPLTAEGVPGFGLATDSRHYFDHHHAPSDTLDKVNPDDLAKNTAAIAALAYVLADQEGTLPRVVVKR
ncbi:MAG TPA: M20/M25/M40 family metallo-hydrolase [Thermoanaerobaculia bacterium]|nr:M20/M25/M40 family metallo-hydrolase [Thermoanaerobaculia bacterium]